MRGKELTDFAIRYIKAGLPHDSSVFNRIYVTDCSASSIVYVSGLFSVEMYMVFPNGVFPPHSHPCETITYKFAGDALGFGPTRGVLSDVTEIGDTHELTAGPEGTIIYVMTKWESKEQMESSSIRYIGEPVGPIHKKMKEQYEAKNNSVSKTN